MEKKRKNLTTLNSLIPSTIILKLVLEIDFFKEVFQQASHGKNG
jgi:hypothetical protein